MKRSLALVVTLASGLALSAAAQTLPLPPPPAAPAGPAKIAVIAFQVAVAQTNEGQRNFADLQKKYEPKRQQLKTLSDDIDNLTKQLQAQGDKLSPAEQRQPRQGHRQQEEAARSRPPRTRRTTSSRRCRRCTTAWPPRCTTFWPATRSSRASRWCSTSASSRTRCSMPAIDQHHQAGDRRLQREVGRSRAAGPACSGAPLPAARAPSPPLTRSGSEAAHAKAPLAGPFCCIGTAIREGQCLLPAKESCSCAPHSVEKNVDYFRKSARKISISSLAKSDRF